MGKVDEIQFHSDRAKAELELARSASSPAAARPHFALAELHGEKLRALGEAQPAQETKARA
jgi:hypothetical protein